MSDSGKFQQFRKGSTILLILSVLRDESKYGYQIMREIERRSDGYFKMTAALLYPALHRLDRDGLIRSEWRQEEGKHRRKYYTITQPGREALLEHTQEWRTFFDKLLVTIKPPATLAEGK